MRVTINLHVSLIVNLPDDMTEEQKKMMQIDLVKQASDLQPSYDCQWPEEWQVKGFVEIEPTIDPTVN